MGRYRNHRSRTTKNKSYSKFFRTRCRPMDLDQIQDKLKDEEENGKQVVVDEDLPGLGQFSCTYCAKYFINSQALDDHLKTKPHLRRIKKTTDKQYSHDEAELGAGKTKEILPPAHPKNNME